MSWLPDWITGYDSENAAAAAQADIRNKEITAIWVRSGNLTPAQGEAAAAAVDAGMTSPEQDRAAVEESFEEGWNEGAANIRGAVSGTITGTIGTVWKLVPWWLWLAAAAAVFIYFGGAGAVRQNFSRA